MPIEQYGDVIDDTNNVFEGQLVYPERAEVRTGINSDAVILPFGRAVALGADGDGDGTRLPGLLPVDANSVLIGVLVQSNMFEKLPNFSIDADGNMGYPLSYEFSYCVDGVIGVYTTVAVTPDDPVFWIHTPTATERKGQFRNDANTNRAVQVANARFLKSAAADTVVPLSIKIA